MRVRVASSDFAVAFAAAAGAVAVAWRPDAVPVWLAAAPMGALVAQCLSSEIYQAPIAHRGWRRIAEE